MTKGERHNGGKEGRRKEAQTGARGIPEGQADAKKADENSRSQSQGVLTSGRFPFKLAVIFTTGAMFYG